MSFGPIAVERRERPHQHEVQALVALRLLHHEEIARRLHDAQERAVAPGRAAQLAHRVLGKAVAFLAVPDFRENLRERAAQSLRARPVALQQVVGHALRRLGSHAGQAAQRGDQLFER